MSLREAILSDFVHYFFDSLMEEQNLFFRVEFSSLGNSSLHDMCKSTNSEGLRKLLKAYTGPVDIVDPESGVTPLAIACKFGNLNSVKLLVQKGANVNHRCNGMNKFSLKYTDVTPIYIAAQEGHESIVEYLGRQGAEVNVQMWPMGFTPLHQAVFLRRDEVVAVLINQFKAKVNIPCIETPGSYPIYNAVVVKELDILGMILEAEDVDPNVGDPTESVTALHIGAYNGDSSSVELLIKHGANVNAQLKSGHTPLDLAIQNRNRHVVEFLKERGARRRVLDKSWHPFHACVISGLTSLKAAVNRGADINSSLQKGMTALHYSVVKRNMDACKFLIRKGADMEQRDILGRTPLHLAAQLGLNLFVEFLSEKGANINAQNNLTFTPLHSAALEGHAVTCKLLLSKGADIEAMGWEIGTPLVAAIAKSHTGVVKLLLKSGANPNARNPEDSIDRVTAFQVAIRFAADKPEILRALVEAGADVRDHIVVQNGTLSPLHILPLVTYNVESLKILIEAGAFLDSHAVCVSSSGNAKFCLQVNRCAQGEQCMLVNYSSTPLQSAKNGGDPHLIRLLENTLELFKAVRKNDLVLAQKFHGLGGLVNCCSVRYDTPLIYASWKGYVEMVKFLLQRGAKIDMPNVQNSSPLHYAAKYNQKDVAIQLLKAGALIDLVRANKTPLELAREHNFPDLVALLEFVQKYLEGSRTKKISPYPSWRNDERITSLVSKSEVKISEQDLDALFSHQLL